MNKLSDAAPINGDMLEEASDHVAFGYRHKMLVETPSPLSSTVPVNVLSTSFQVQFQAKILEIALLEEPFNQPQSSTIPCRTGYLTEYPMAASASSPIKIIEVYNYFSDSSTGWSRRCLPFPSQ